MWEAEQEISNILVGKPFRVDSADVVPIHRPRFCWTNVHVLHIPGVRWEEKARWIEITFEHAYPSVDSWLEEGASWPGGDRGTVLPTCLKVLKRQKPPPAPAGIGKCDYSTIQRWRADDFRFPPLSVSRRFSGLEEWEMEVD